MTDGADAAVLSWQVAAVAREGVARGAIAYGHGATPEEALAALDAEIARRVVTWSDAAAAVFEARN